MRAAAVTQVVSYLSYVSYLPYLSSLDPSLVGADWTGVLLVPLRCPSEEWPLSGRPRGDGFISPPPVIRSQPAGALRAGGPPEGWGALSLRGAPLWAKLQTLGKCSAVAVLMTPGAPPLGPPHPPPEVQIEMGTSLRPPAVRGTPALG
ncbi:unnamed protein product [Gadus morhua 'NCC']